MVTGTEALPASSKTVAWITLSSGWSWTGAAQEVVPEAELLAQPLTVTTTLLTPVGLGPPSEAVPVMVTIWLLTVRPLCGPVIVTTGGVVSGWTAGKMDKRSDP